MDGWSQKRRSLTRRKEPSEREKNWNPRSGDGTASIPAGWCESAGRAQNGVGEKEKKTPKRHHFHPKRPTLPGFTEFHCRLPSFMAVRGVSPSFIAYFDLYRILIGSGIGITSFTGFSCRVIVFYRVWCWNIVLPSFTGFYRVLPSFTEFYRVLLGFTEFYRVLPSFTEFYWVSPSCTGLSMWFSVLEWNSEADQ